MPLEEKKLDNKEDDKTSELKLDFPGGSKKDDEMFEFDQYDSVTGKKLYLVIGGLLAIIVIVFLFFYMKGDGDEIVASSAKEEKVKPVQKSHDLKYSIELPEITTNLAQTAGKDTWIKLAVTVQLDSTKDQASIDKKLPIIKDAIIVFLREVRASDLSSSGGSMMLKTELVKRINKILYPVEVKDIYLREMLLDN